jgi:hypothetical protein
MDSFEVVANGSFGQGGSDGTGGLFMVSIYRRWRSDQKVDEEVFATVGIV